MTSLLRHLLPGEADGLPRSFCQALLSLPRKVFVRVVALPLHLSRLLPRHLHLPQRGRASPCLPALLQLKRPRSVDVHQRAMPPLHQLQPQALEREVDQGNRMQPQSLFHLPLLHLPEVAVLLAPARPRLLLDGSQSHDPQRPRPGRERQRHELPVSVLVEFQMQPPQSRHLPLLPSDVAGLRRTPLSQPQPTLRLRLLKLRCLRAPADLPRAHEL